MIVAHGLRSGVEDLGPALRGGGESPDVGEAAQHRLRRPCRSRGSVGRLAECAPRVEFVPAEHRVDESSAIGRAEGIEVAARRAIAVEEGAHDGRRRLAEHDASPPQRQRGHLLLRRDRPSLIPVDKQEGAVRSLEEVLGVGVAMTHHGRSGIIARGGDERLDGRDIRQHRAVLPRPFELRALDPLRQRLPVRDAEVAQPLDSPVVRRDSERVDAGDDLADARCRWRRVDDLLERRAVHPLVYADESIRCVVARDRREAAAVDRRDRARARRCPHRTLRTRIGRRVRSRQRSRRAPDRDSSP